MALPHPQARQDNRGNGDKSDHGGIFGKLFKRTVSITDDRNAKEEVNPAKNRTLDALGHDDCAPDGFAFAGGGLSTALLADNEPAATVRTQARVKRHDSLGFFCYRRLASTGPTGGEAPAQEVSIGAGGGQAQGLLPGICGLGVPAEAKMKLADHR